MSFDVYVNDTHCDINLTKINFDEIDTKNFKYILCGPLLATIIIIGIIGNILSLNVFCRTVNRPRIYYFLIVLACWDLCLLCCSFLLYSIPVLLYGRSYSFGPYVMIYPTFYMFTNMAHSGSIWIVVVLALERYFALCHPLKYLTWDTEDRAKILLGTVSFLAVIYHVPRYFELRLIYCRNSESPVMETDLIPLVLPSNLRDNNIYRILKVVGGLLFFSFGTLMSLLLLTTRVSIEVRKNMKLQRQLTGTRKKLSVRASCASRTSSGSIKRVNSKKANREDKQNLDLMLVAVMIKFCICHTLPTVLDVCETIMGDDWHSSLFFDTVVDISNVLVVVNSSCNFAIYYVSSLKFRSGLKAMRRRSSDYALLKLRSLSQGYGGASSAKFFSSNNAVENSSVPLV